MPVGPSDPSLPQDAAATGAWRVRALDEALLGRAPAARPPATLDQELPAWAGEILASARGPARGLLAAQVPERWRARLAWAGVPFGTAGDLGWGVHFQEQPGLAVPERRGSRLLLPQPEALAQLTSLALKPLRLFVAAQLGCRLQSAAGVHVYQWENQAALVSCVAVPIGGFLYGPQPGQRHSLSILPGAFQLVSW
jgi:hypothetical protein